MSISCHTQRLYIVWVFALACTGLFSCARSSAQVSPQANEANPIGADGATVYVTETGDKYHTERCASLAKSKIAISRDDATAQGYEPCAICCPAEAKPAAAGAGKEATFKARGFPMTITGKVVAVADGDTITVLVGTEQYKIRLDAIDCPEKKQAYGQKAKEYMSGLVFSKTVTVALSGQDRYGRYLGTVTVDGLDVNRAMIRSGFAWHYRQYSKDATLDELEALARSERLGLWKDANPIPPWDFRN